MVDIPGTLAVLSQAIGIVKDLREVEKGLSEGEIKARMAEMYSSLADVKMALADTQEELRAKDQEIDRLRSAFATKEKTVKERGFSLLTFEDGEPKGEPFCPVCEQKAGRYFHLSMMTGKFKCPNCKAEYGDAPVHVWERY
ncbi:hypothetical protein [Neorhizobium tomejilense]|uniref:hypothetical protein n=1 Tax=Neorhizobium tomejilense TaxID=2093828 RepID=UPI000CFA6E74|nr:hypothetical protein [Neorhizobium tomejilense]